MSKVDSSRYEAAPQRTPWQLRGKWHPWKPIDGDQAQVDMEANQQDQEEVEEQIEDAHGGQSPPQRLTRSMFKALGARGQLFSLFVISLVEGA